VEHGLAALKVFSKTDSPRWWAAAQQNLGLAHSKQIKGNRRKNLEKAMICFNEALSVWNEELFPRHWTETDKLLKETRKKLDQIPRIWMNHAS